MPTVGVTMDLSRCRCRVKLEKILCSIEEGCGVVFDKVETDYQKGQVLITGTFDAIELCCKIQCKARSFVTKVEIVPPKTKETKDDQKEDNKERQTQLIPFPCPVYPYPYSCPSSNSMPPYCPSDSYPYDPYPSSSGCSTPPYYYCPSDSCKPKPPPPVCRLPPPPREWCPPPPPPPPMCPVPQPPCPFPSCRPPSGYEEPDGSCTVM